MAQKFKITSQSVNGEDVESDFSSDDIFKQLKAAGYNVLSMSPDGNTITLDDNDGEGQYEKPITVAAKALGASKIRPVGARTDKVSTATRYVLSQFDNDTERKEWLERKLKKRGVENPQLVGQDTDWYSYDPTTQQYDALSNADNDKYNFGGEDLAEYAPKAARVGASAAGSIYGGPVGAMGAGLATGAALRGAAALDPDYRAVAGQTPALREAAKNMTYDMGLDATMGTGMAVAKRVPGVASIAQGGVLGRTMAGVGTVAEKAGAALKGTGTLMDNELGHQVAVQAVDPLNTVQGVGLVSRAGKFGITAIPKLLNYAGEKLGMKGVSETAQGFMSPRELAKGGQSLVSQGLDRLEGSSLKMAGEGAREAPQAIEGVIPRPTKATGRELTARDVLGNAGEKLGKGFENMSRELDRSSGPTQAQVDAMTEQEIADLQRKLGNSHSRALGRVGEAAGGAFDSLDRGGQMLMRAADKGGEAIVKTGKGVGARLERGGAGLRKAGNIIRPYEAPLSMRSALEDEDSKRRILDKYRTMMSQNPYGSAPQSSNPL